jgi:hypothetical protein
MMYYRVAVQVDAAPTWKWKSTVLASLEALFRFLRLYNALPPDNLRVFTSSSPADLTEQLVRENKGLGSPSLTATQFLQERRLGSPGRAWGASDCREQEIEGNQKLASIPSLNQQGKAVDVLAEKDVCSLDRRRLELERGAGGDHDLPYTFILPSSLPQVLRWVRLLVKVQQGNYSRRPPVGEEQQLYEVDPFVSLDE